MFVALSPPENMFPLTRWCEMLHGPEAWHYETAVELCAGYYRYWEKNVLEAICAMLTAAVQTLLTKMGASDSGSLASSAVPLLKVRWRSQPMVPCITD